MHRARRCFLYCLNVRRAKYGCENRASACPRWGKRIYRSDAEKFIIEDNALLPPLASLAGMGTKAAQGIVEARKNGVFTSIENLRRRSGISKTNIDILRDHGCLLGMSESDQVSLFG